MVNLARCGLGADSGDPVSNRLSDELGAVVGPDVGRHAAQDEQIAQDIDHAGGVELSLDLDGQALPTVLIKDVECPECFLIVGSTMHEVIGPDMVAMLRTQTDAGSIIQP